MLPKRETVTDTLVAFLLWTLAAACAGLYVQAARGAGAPWPTILPEYGGALLVAMALPEGAAPWTVNGFWVGGWIVTGLLNVGAFALTAPFFEGRRAVFTYALLRFSACGALVTLPGIAVLWSVGAVPGGFSFETVRSVAAGTAGAGRLAPWIGPAFTVTSLAALGLYGWLYSRVFGVPGRKMAGHVAVSLAATALMVAGAGSLANLAFLWAAR